MRKPAVLFLFAFSVVVFGQVQHQWSFNSQNFSTGQVDVFSMCTDASENVYVTGSYTGLVDFDPGTGSIGFPLTVGVTKGYFAKYDANGAMLFAKQIGGTGRSIAINQNNEIVITGEFTGTRDFDPGTGSANLISFGSNDVYIAKYDASGAFLFVKQIGGAGVDNSLGLTTDLSNNIYITGDFSLTADFDPSAASFVLSPGGTASSFIAKYDNSGTFSFAKQLVSTASSGCYSTGIKTDGAGNIIIAGYLNGTVDMDPGAGTDNIGSNGSAPDLFFAKYNASGDYLLAKPIGNTGQDFLRALAVDVNNNIYISGCFQNTVDFDPGGGTANLSTSGGKDAFVAKYNSAGNYVYAIDMGGTTNIPNVEGFSLATDASENVYVSGTFTGTVDFDAGGATANLSTFGANDVFFAKYSSSGAYIHAKQIGGTTLEKNYAIALSPLGNIWIGGSFAGNSTGLDFDPGAGTQTLSGYPSSYSGYIAKYTNAGNYSWVGGFLSYVGNNQGSDFSYNITKDAAGNVYTTGCSFGALDFEGGTGIVANSHSGANECFFAKHDAAGNAVLAKTIPANISTNAFFSIAVDTVTNAIYIAGNFNGTTDFDPGVGYSALTSTGAQDIFFAKYDANGNYVFAKRIGGTNADYISGIKVDGSGSLYVTGTFQGTIDFNPGAGTANLVGGSPTTFIAKYDINGNYVYAFAETTAGAGNKQSIVLDAAGNAYTTGGTVFRKYDSFGTLVLTKQFGTASTYMQGIDVDASGNIYVTGYFSGSGDFDPGAATATLSAAGNKDAFFARYDAAGNYVYAKQIGGINDDVANDIAVDANGNVNITGYFSGTADFDPTAASNFLVSNAGSEDVFISRYNGSGNIIYAKKMGGVNNDRATGLSIKNTGIVNVFGTFSDVVDFDPGTGTNNLTATQDDDLFIGQYLQSVLTATLTINNNVSCFGGTNGSATVSATGNQSPFVYLWQPGGQTSATVNNLGAGTHTVTVTDAIGTTVTLTVSITQPTALTSVVGSQSNVTCFGGTNGFVSLNTSGGSLPYTYSWSPAGGTGSSSSSLIAGNYTVSITDNNGCPASVTFFVSQPGQFNLVTASQINVSCFGGSNGIASVNATGGSGGNVYSWSPGGYTTTTAAGLSANNYTVTAIDLNGCIAQTNVIITQPAVLAGAVASVTHITCFGQTNGGATVTVTGGTVPYSYNWQPVGGAGNTASGLSAGNYTLQTTDNKGCVTSNTVTVQYLAEIQEICVVTADSATATHNIIVWEKPSNVGNIDSFKIYREITTNVFQQIGAVHGDSLSEYHDMGANPNSTSYKYRVTVLDTCGGEGDPGLYHKSIHLQYLSLGNFQWSYYEIENTSNQVASYNFYRDDNSTGNFVLQQIIPGTNNSYTDVNYASFPLASYRVDVNWLSGQVCTSSMRNGNGNNQVLGAINTSRSNIKSPTSIGINKMDVNDFFKVYPNPAQNVLTIEYTIDKNETIRIELENTLGQCVYKTNVKENKHSIDIEPLPSGVYLVKIAGEKMMNIKKIIIN
jgi:hypothetical protein